MEKRLFLPLEEQDYLDRVVDEKAHWEQTEQKRLDGIVNEKAAIAIKSKKRMERKFKEYDKTTFFDKKELKAYWKARKKYIADVDQLNTARVNSGLPPKPAFERQAPPKKGPIEKALDKTERFLKRIGFSGEVSTPSVPLYTTTPPKSTPSYVPDYGPTLPTQPTSRPITTPAPVAEPHTAPTFQNPFIPLAPNTLPPVSMPTLPHSLTPVVPTPPPRPTFGEKFHGAIRNLFDQGFPNSAPLKPRTQVMIFPQVPSTPQNLPQFTPDLQNRYPEAYALARNIDQFGRERVALFRVTLENHQRRPQLFREFDALPNLLERATGHTLHTPGLTPERPTPLSLRVEALAVATLSTTRDFVVESVRHPIQSRIDLTVGVTKRVGHYIKEGLKLLVNMRNPNDRISREMVETLDTVAANLDRLFTTWVQKHNPQHSPGSASTTVGGIALDITLWETGSILIRGPRVIAATERISLISERLALQSQRALQKEAMALERLTQPVLRSGVPKVPKISPLSLSRTEKQVIREIDSLKGTKRIDFVVRDVCNKRSLVEKELRAILKHEGFTPPPRPIGIPKDWNVGITYKNGGVKYSLKKPSSKGPYTVIEIRVMDKDIFSPQIGQQRPYVTHKVNGKFLDKKGNIVPRMSTEAHIEYKEYDFLKLMELRPYE